MGLVIYTLALRRKAMEDEQPKRDLFEPLTFLDYCHCLGAGGIQLPLGVRDVGYSRKLRERAQRYGMYIEGILSMPARDRDVERFAAEVRTAAETGVQALRTVLLPGRRYEHFANRKEYLAAAEQSRQAVLRTVPILERDHVRLAIENHKDRRSAELVALLRDISSEYVGVCVDLGNNFTLLEDTVAVVEALAPWAFSVHIKDQAVQQYDEGFLFADVPLGQGFLDLKKMVGLLRRAKPGVRFNLETITRDPLKVPVLRDEYWATFPDVPGRDLARTLRVVRTQRAQQLPQVSRMPMAEQLACESAGITASFQYARQTLGL
jgi:sugar phosphate isomerase/epimerase